MQKNSSNSPQPKTQWWRSVCRAPSSAKIGDFVAYSDNKPLPIDSAIDQYFSRTEALIVHGTQQLLDGNADIANLLFVGIVSQTENYFRELFSKLLQVCPTSQAKSSARDIKLGSVIWFKTGRIERGAFEAFSFASADNITDTARKYFDITLDAKSDCHDLLQQYDRLCELRHAIVHSGGIMSGKNALKLQFPRTDKNLHVRIDFSKFQEASGICTSLVCSLNSEFFRTFANRWRDDWPKLSPKWDAKLSANAFKEVWQIFHSRIDEQRAAIPLLLTAQKCKAEILRP